MSLVRIAAAEDAGSRADVFVSLYFDVTRTAAARLLAEGAVTVNGAPAAKNTRIAAGDERAKACFRCFGEQLCDALQPQIEAFCPDTLSYG